MKSEPNLSYTTPKVRVMRVQKHHLSLLAILLVVATVALGVSGFFAAPQAVDAWMTNTGANWKSTSAYSLNPAGWVSTGSSLPGNVYGSQIATIGDYVYLFGGLGSRTIYRAPVSNPTSWTNTGSLIPGNLGDSQLAIIGDYVYLFGGYVGDGYDTDDIYRAPVSNPLSWTNTGATIPVPASFDGGFRRSSLAIIGDYVYLFGGRNYWTHTNIIFRAPLSNPTAWVNTGATLPSALSGSNLAIIGDYVYLFGGSSNVIYRAPLSNPLSWSNTGATLPSFSFSTSQLAIIGDYMYLFAGQSTQIIARASVSNPTSWTNTGSTFPIHLYSAQLAILGSNVYMFGGLNNSNFNTIIYRAPLTSLATAPTVTTSAASSVGASSATLNGSITATGGVNATARGFARGTTSTLTGASVSTSTESGSFGTGAFTGSASSLTGNTTYYARAYATNSAGTGYGSIQNFLTLPGTPGTPTFSTITTTSLRVSWTAPTGDATSYKVERCSGASCSNFSEVATGVTDLFLDQTSLTPNVSYSYRVRGTNTGGDGAYSGTGTQVTNGSSCSFDGTTVNHGASATAYQSPSVPYGESCEGGGNSETRSCTNGTLSGSYAYASCAPVAYDGTALEGWAWSETTGWLSLSGSSYGLYIDDEGVLAGYAWSENIGWVSANDDDLGGCPQTPCEAYMNSSLLSGWLRALASDDVEAGGWDGFIALSDMDTNDGAEYGVTLEEEGDFSGFAWGDMNIGWLDFGYASTEYEPCTADYQCLDETHYDNLCTPTITENLSCAPTLVCIGGVVACSLPADATGELTLNPSLVPTGTVTLVSWDVADTSSCRVFGENGDEWFGGATGAQTSSAIIQTTLYTLECANSFGEATTTIDVAYATVVPTWVER